MNYFECCMACHPPKRYPGCSGKCPEYKEARAKFDADKAKKNTGKDLRYYTIERRAQTADGVAKYAKKRPRKYRYG